MTGTGPFVSDNPPLAVVALVALLLVAMAVIMAKAFRQLRNPNLRSDEW